MWLQTFSAIAYKELTQLKRNKVVLRRIVTLQSMQFFMLAWLDVNVRDMPAVIVDQDRTAESRELVDRVAATHTFKIKYTTSSTDQAREHIKAGRAQVALVVPPEYAHERSAGRTGRVLVLADGSNTMASTQAIVSINGVAARLNLEAQQELVDGAVTPHTVLLFNPQGRTSSFMLPALLAIVLSNTYSGNSMRRLVMERGGGHLERLLMSPMNNIAFIVGKLVPWFFVALLNAVIFLLVARWGFQVPIRGSLALLLVAVSLYIATVLSVGSAIAAGSKNMVEANAAWLLFLFPSIMLSGYIFPLSSLPKWLLPISYLIPHTHFMEVMRGICLRGATATELAPHLIYLLVTPIVLSIVAAFRFARSVRV